MRGYIYLAVFAVCLLNVFAKFDVSVEELDNRITVDEFARFEITITSHEDVADEFYLSNMNFPTWDVRTDPIANPITVPVGPKSSGRVEVLVDPLKIKEIGTYAVNVNVRSSNDERQSQIMPLKVMVISTDTLIQGYVPTIATNINMPENVDSQQEINIRITLNNQNIINYEELLVKVDSKLLHKELTTALGPREEKVVEIKAILDKSTPPQQDNLVLTLYYGERSIINPQVASFQVLESVQKRLVEERKGFLRTTKTYEIISNNPAYEGTFKVQTSLFSSLFSSETPNARIIKDEDGRYFEWDVRMDGSTRTEVSVRTNYLPLFIIALLLIGLVVVYVVLRSPLTLVKEAANVVKKEGGVAELSVIIHVKNRGQRRIEHIDVNDVIPSLVSVEREVTIGSLQPSKILRHEKKGHTVVKWDIPVLEPSEERVLTYRMKSKLSILGGFTLPACSAIFKQDGRTLNAASNVLQVNH